MTQGLEYLIWRAMGDIASILDQLKGEVPEAVIQSLKEAEKNLKELIEE